MLPRLEPDPESETNGPVDRDERLGEAIEAYLELAEKGGPTDPEEFAKGYPDLGDDLVAALEGLALVQGLVGEANGPGHRLEEGRRVAGYRIVRELGRGGMGIVYEAVHVGLDRPVALKVLGTQAAPDSSGRRRFLNEAKTAAGLHHTHIVPVFDVGQVGGLCYYAMQRIEGSGLDRVLRTMRRDRSVAAGSTLGSGSRKSPGSPSPNSKSKPTARPSIDAALALSGLGEDSRSWGGLGDVGGGSNWRRREPVDEPPAFTPPRGSAYYRWVADVGRQAAEALAHAHQRGVIHRDVKPSNLLVDARGMIWVADFGLARRLADPSQTQFDSMLGTPRYMSPEQARTGPIDGRADVYSLGATLYELITLRPPFDGQSAAELIDQIKTREPARPRKFDQRVPLDLETILLKALAKRPDDRYATADELAEDLARFLAFEPVKARRIGPVGRMVRFARRHPSLTAVSTTASAVVLGTATFAYVRVLDERDRAADFAVAAQKAQAETEKVNLQLTASFRDGLEKQASNVGLSNAANRRATGLDLLRRAAAMEPDPAQRVRLRDLGIAFLSTRDLEAKAPIETPDKPQHGLIFGDGGKLIAALSDDGELAIWDVAGRKRIESTPLPIGPMRGGQPKGKGSRRFGSPRIASAGEQIAVIRPDGGGVRLFDFTNLDAPADFLPMKGYQVSALHASLDGRSLVTHGRPTTGNPSRPMAGDRPGPGSRPDPLEEPRLCLWDRDHREAPKTTLTLPTPKADNSIRWLWSAISPDGSRIAAARSNEPEVWLWDGEGRPLLPSIEVQGNPTALAMGPAGLLAIASSGGEIALWDLTSSRPKRLFSLGLHQMVNHLRFSPRDGSILAAASSGGGIELWDLATRTVIAELPIREVDDLSFSPDGRTLAAGQPSSIALWSLAEPIGQDVLPESGDLPFAMAFGPGDLLAIASRDATPALAPLRLWEGPGRCPPSVEAWDQVRPSSVGFDDQGRLFTLESDAVRWYLPPSREPVEEVALPPVDLDPRPSGPQRKPDSPSPRTTAGMVARSASGRAILLGRMDGYLLWRADEPDRFARLDRSVHIEGFGRGIPAVFDLPGNRLYYLNRRGEELACRDLRNDRTRRSAWTIDVQEATLLAINLDGSTLAVAERSGQILLVDTSRGVVRKRLTPPPDDPATADSLAFSPDGRTLAVGSREQIRLWTIDGEPRAAVRLPGLRGAVRSLAFDAKGTRLATADEKTIKVWDLGPLHAELARLGLDW
jgi:eukaryotic-like serine/threonine-protein kinase